MLLDKRILVVVPARGGSKGVKLKNLHPLAGKPLLAHTGELVRRLAYVDRALVSTDHPEIARAARECGLDAPFMRPVELSGDLIGDTEVLQHALRETEEIDALRYDVVVMLQPTCPLRREEHVTAAVEKLIRGGWDSVWTVNRTDVKYHPLKQLVLNAEGALSLFAADGRRIIARQQLQPTYTRNGAAYAIRRACLLEQETTLGAHSTAIVLEEPMVSIDTLADFTAVERELTARR
ncbi:MAG: acylneuraminate cytidylyltransferase family protein [Gemmataceae bacterium]|nr:acylneuraminate cytidylyltransferase family protein [Gemmataceae bacterium]